MVFSEARTDGSCIVVFSKARTDGSCIVGALRGSDRWIVYSGCSQRLGQMDRV